MPARSRAAPASMRRRRCGERAHHGPVDSVAGRADVRPDHGVERSASGAIRAAWRLSPRARPPRVRANRVRGGAPMAPRSAPAGNRRSRRRCESRTSQTSASASPTSAPRPCHARLRPCTCRAARGWGRRRHASNRARRPVEQRTANPAHRFLAPRGDGGAAAKSAAAAPRSAAARRSSGA
jgi:hypothetical protein